MRKKVNEKLEPMDRRIWDLLVKEEKKLGRGYAEWTDIEKVSFVLENRISNLFSDTFQVINKINETVSNVKSKHREDVVGRREKDIQRLESLGFRTVLETPERFTSYKPYDSDGTDFMRRQKFYYKETYFVHPRKSIYLAMEHFFCHYAFDYLGDVSGYMIVKKDEDVLKDISRHIFWDWSIDVVDSKTFGIPLYPYNFNDGLAYLEQDKVMDFHEAMTPLYLTLDIAEKKDLHWPFSLSEKLEFCNKIVKSMEGVPQSYFNLNDVKQYSKYRSE